MFRKSKFNFYFLFAYLNFPNFSSAIKSYLNHSKCSSSVSSLTMKVGGKARLFKFEDCCLQV